MKTLEIKWQRLVSKGQTCPRCGLTEKELKLAISTLKKSLAPLKIKVILEKNELSVAKFKKDPLSSNQIWLNNRPLEDWINGKIGKSQCCDVCGPAKCRTLGVGEETYETIPADLIIRAGLLAASQIITLKIDKGCCVDKPKKLAKNSCCSK